MVPRTNVSRTESEVTIAELATYCRKALSVRMRTKLSVKLKSGSANGLAKISPVLRKPENTITTIGYSITAELPQSTNCTSAACGMLAIPRRLSMRASPPCGRRQRHATDRDEIRHNPGG